jgi:hypothetical protein
VTKMERERGWALLTSRPFSPRFQLLVAPVLLYLAGEVGTAAWRVALATLVGLVIAWLGSRALRRETWAWCLVTIIAAGNLLFGLVAVVGITKDLSRWAAAAVGLLSCLILQALLASTIRPRQETWGQLCRQRPLIFAGAVVFVLTLVAGDANQKEDLSLVEWVSGLAGLTWAYFAWQAIRRFRDRDAQVSATRPTQ